MDSIVNRDIESMSSVGRPRKTSPFTTPVSYTHLNFTLYDFFPEEELNDMVFAIATPSEQ